MAKIFKISEKTLKNMYQKVTFDDRFEQDVQYRLSKQKQFFDSTTVEFYQTYLNLPIWQAGVTITVKHNPSLKDSPYLIIHSVNTSQKGFDAKLPPSNIIEHYKKLFHINNGKKQKDTQKSLSAKKKKEPSNFIRGLINNNKLNKSTKKIIDDNTSLIRGRLYVYKYNKDSRLPKVKKVDTSKKVNKNDEVQGFENTQQPTLPLYPVDDKIKHGHYYVIVEITFSFTTKEYGQINWLALVELETKSGLYLRALVANVNGQVFKHDPITITSNFAHAPIQNNGELNPFRTSEVLNNLDLPVGGIQSLSGTRVNITNVHNPNIAPPTNPTGADFNYAVRTDDFSAVNAYYHTERFFALVESLGFPIDTYFNNTTFPIPIDHRGLHLSTNGIEVNAHFVGNGVGGIGHCLARVRELLGAVAARAVEVEYRREPARCRRGCHEVGLDPILAARVRERANGDAVRDLLGAEPWRERPVLIGERVGDRLSAAAREHGADGEKSDGDSSHQARVASLRWA